MKLASVVRSGIVRLLLVALAAIAPAAAATLRVVSDNNYPPYLFIGPDGKAEGYVVDLWQLWSRKTGIAVELRALGWAEAQRQLLDGEADVIDMIYRTRPREAKYDFSAPYARLPVAIYGVEGIGGIHDLASLRGFEIGVQDGDACIDHLQAGGISTLRRFGSYTEIINAAAATEIRIFCLDEFPANYYFYRLQTDRKFFKAFELYHGEFHRAVRKGEQATLDTVERGMAQISAAELEQLRRKWLGEPVAQLPDVRLIGLVLLAASVAGIALLAWVRVLRSLVARRTAELEGERARLRTLIENIPDPVWVKAADGRYRDCNPPFERLLGLPRQRILGCRGEDLLVAPAAAADAAADRATLAAGRPQVSEIAIDSIADGEPRLLETIRTPIPGGDGSSGILAIARDITERKRQEREIMALGSQLQATLDAMPDLVFETDLDGRYLSYHSPRSELLAVPAAQLLGRTIVEILPADAAAVCMAALDTALRDGYAGGSQFRLPLPDGEHWFEISVARKTGPEPGKPSFIVLSRDISARKRTEQALEESRERLSLAIEAAHAGTWEWDLASGRLHCSEQARRLLGISAATSDAGAGGRTAWSRSIAAADRDRVEAGIVAAVEAGREFETEWRVAGDSAGGPRWLLSRGRPVLDALARPQQYLGVVVDVSSRHEAEERQRRHELLERELDILQGVLDSSLAGYWDWNMAAGSEYLSPTLKRMFGYADDTLPNHPDSRRRLLFAEDRELAAEVFARHVASHGRIPYYFEARYHHRDGSTVWSICAGQVVQWDDADQPLRMVGCHIDVTLLHRRLDLLVEANQRAESASRAKSAFLANMSHEIRTPLNAIIGFAHLMRRAGVTPQQAEQLERINNAGEHLLEVINAVLDLSKIEAGKFVLDSARIEVDQIVGRVVAMVRAQAEAKGLRLIVDSPPGPALVGDRTRLEQALLNLVGNAVKFTEHGSVTIATTLEQPAAERCMVRFEVRDTGPGIESAVLERLFSDFEQADNSSTRRYGGSGLGLAITRHLATLMGGTAGARSAPGKGSCFWFSACLAPADAALPEAAPVPPGHSAEATLRTRHSGRRILVVEDEPVNREVAVALLADVGLVVEVAEDGEAGLAASRSRRYDLILMDMQMPRLGGPDAARQILRLPGTPPPIVAMTANAFAEERAECLAAGMSDFLSKPVDPEVLFATVLRWLEAPADAPRGA